MKYTEYINLLSKTEEDFFYKGHTSLIYELRRITLDKSKKLDLFLKNNDLERFAYSLYEGLAAGFFIILYIILNMLIIPIYYFSRLFKKIFYKFKIYNIVSYPLVKFNNFILVLQTNTILINLDNYLITEKEKFNFKMKFYEANKYLIWYTFVR
jgi:hypothetical protein